MKFLLLWIIGAILYFIFSSQPINSAIGILTAFIICFFTALISNIISDKRIAYILFFTITLTSFFGITETLTGSHATSTQPFLFGLSFYTATLAYLIFTKKYLKYTDVIKLSNPLLLATGPIALFIKDYQYRSFSKRFNYYFPYIVIGVFFYQIIAVPLTHTFELINSTDLISALVFASIFELFVYANFCGLSLIIYGLFGIIGYRVPLNFRQPFTSTNVIDFWKGWHTSLSPVLKNLFYLPLRKKYSSSIALLGVYLASAMWHGVTFNFLLWGLFHALMFIVTIYLLKYRIKYLPLLILIIAIVIGRLLFADSQTERLIEKLNFTYNGFHHAFKVLKEIPNSSKAAILLGFSLISIEFFFRNFKNVSKRNYKHLRTPISLCLLVIIGILLANNSGVDFAVYGQR